MALRLRGRQAQIETLREQLDTTRAGRGGIVLIKGLAGLGKSALLTAAGEMARAKGISVYAGAGDVATQVVPLGPLLEALVAADDPPVDPAVLRDLSYSPDQRFWLLRELQESLERAALRSPMLISIDDVQWADAATLVALSTLPRHLAPHRILWLLAVRSGEWSPAVRAAIIRLEGDAVTITLDPLDEAAVASVATDMLGGTPEPALLRVLQGVQGQPFLLTELLRGLRDEQLVEVDDGIAGIAGTQLPVRFLDSVNDHLARLSPGARDALQLASVLGRRFSADELAAIAGTSYPAILAALREAMEAGLVVEDSGRLAFRHDLVREAVETSLPRTVRQSLRRRAVDVLLRDGTPPVEIAKLVMEVAQPGDRQAIGILRQAAAETAHVSPTIASQLSRRALDLLPPGDPDRGSLVAETIAYIVQAGHAAEAVTLISAVAGDLADPAAEAEARLSLAILSMQYAPADVVEQCQRALSLTGVPPGLRIQLLSFLSLGLDLLGDVAAAQAPALEAAQAARATGDLANEVVTLIPRAAHALAVGEWRQALDFAGEAAVRRHSVDGLAVRLWLPDAWKALILINLARLDEAFGLIDAGLQAAQRDGVAAKFRIWSMLRFRALFCSGRLADARAEAEAAIEMADEIGDGAYGYINHIALYVLGRVALHTGDPAGLTQARSSARRLRQTMACPSSQRLGAWLTVTAADAEGNAGLGAEADVAALDPLARGPLATSSPRMYADTAALTGMLLRAGRRADAESVVRRLEDFAAQHPDFPFLDSAAWHARAVLDSDPEAARQAVTLSSADPRPLVRASVLEDAGRLLPASRAADAVPLLETALAFYSAAGAERDAARVRSLLRARGVRPPGGVPHPAPDWPELTESEFAVVSLVAQGATNREVADRLYLSPYTVNSHLRHVFTKLGLRSRVELARLAAQRGTPAPAERSPTG
jgi:DNA-binding CsgD family transcriptional regulator/tetratricopeptide (TPR) repeat protein